MPDSRQETATAPVVTPAAPARPIALPARPASSAAISGNIGMARSSIGFILLLSESMHSTLQLVELLDVDAAALAEQHHQDRKPYRRLRRRHREHEEHEDLPVELA